MKAVIFAAGKGSRFGSMTDNTPKPLISVKNKPIIERIIDNLPPEIEELFIVVDYLGEKIVDHFGESFNGISISYVEQEGMPGTAGALWSVKDRLDGRFLILNGDDLIDRDDFPNLLNNDKWMFGVKPVNSLPDNFFNIILDENGIVKGLERPRDNDAGEFYVATGVSVVDDRIFDYEPYETSKGEYSALLTIIEAADDVEVESFKMKNWFPINHIDHLKRAEERL